MLIFLACLVALLSAWNAYAFWTNLKKNQALMAFVKASVECLVDHEVRIQKMQDKHRQQPATKPN